MAVIILENILRKQHNHCRYPKYMQIYLLPFQKFLWRPLSWSVNRKKGDKQCQRNMFIKCYGSNNQMKQPPSV